MPLLVIGKLRLRLSCLSKQTRTRHRLSLTVHAACETSRRRLRPPVKMPMVSGCLRTVLIDLTADFKFHIKVFAVFEAQRFKILLNLAGNLSLVLSLQRQIRRHIKRQTLIVKTVFSNVVFIVYRPETDKVITQKLLHRVHGSISTSRSPTRVFRTGLQPQSCRSGRKQVFINSRPTCFFRLARFLRRNCRLLLPFPLIKRLLRPSNRRRITTFTQRIEFVLPLNPFFMETLFAAHNLFGQTRKLLKSFYRGFTVLTLLCISSSLSISSLYFGL